MGRGDTDVTRITNRPPPFRTDLDEGSYLLGPIGTRMDLRRASTCPLLTYFGVILDPVTPSQRVNPEEVPILDGGHC